MSENTEPSGGPTVPDVPEDDPGWVTVVHTADRTGVLSHLSGVFSTRGVNVDSISSGVFAGSDAQVTLAFRASPRRCRVLVRSLERLPEVREVEVVPDGAAASQ